MVAWARSFLAERDDGHFERQVAVKLVKRGMDSDAILRRFLHERQILARLDRPHSARLYDGGVTDDGRPFFAMSSSRGCRSPDIVMSRGWTSTPGYGCSAASAAR